MAKKAKTARRRWFPVRLRLSAVAAAVLVFVGLFAVIHAARVPPPRAPAQVRVALPPPPRPAPPKRAEPAPPPAVLAPVQAAPPPPAPMPAPELPAWRKLAAAAPPNIEDRKLIAIVIDDMGVDRKRSQRAVGLPAPVTLSWLPYAPDVGQQAAAARAAGHEILLHVPMQPEGHDNPGPNPLLTSLSADEIRRRLDADLAAVPDAVGLNNHMGSLFTRDARAVAPVIDELKRRGLLFLDSRTTGASVAADVAREAGVPYAVRDVFLDNEATVPAVRAQLAEVEAIARRHGFAIAIGHPHDATLQVLEPWLRSLAARGFAPVPLSAIVQYRIDHPAAAAARG
jgi:polysaccharide deacetylase 2 family uncharacterized protein YibQ